MRIFATTIINLINTKGNITDLYDKLEINALFNLYYKKTEIIDLYYDKVFINDKFNFSSRYYYYMPEYDLNGITIYHEPDSTAIAQFGLNKIQFYKDFENEF